MKTVIYTKRKMDTETFVCQEWQESFNLSNMSGESLQEFFQVSNEDGVCKVRL